MIYDEIEEISEQFEEPEESSKGKKKSNTYESNSSIEDYEKEVAKKTPKPKKTNSSDGQGVGFSAKWQTVVPIGDGKYRNPDTGKIYWEIKI